MAEQAGYYMQPTIHGDEIVFLCEEDLWTVPVAGGTARRLTTERGPVQFPRLSPDGRWIAYSARDEGPQEVYVCAATGGPSRRLTHLGGMQTQCAAWRPDSSGVIVRSNAQQAFAGQSFLYDVALTLDAKGGGHPRRLDVGPARFYEREPDGVGVALGINTGDPARWKRYRGGTAGRIWVDRKGDGTFRPLIRLDGNLGNPMWIGKRIYFISDHEGHGNLYSCTPTGRGLRRHTDHERYYARFPSSDGRRIVYHAGGDLYVYDPASDGATKVEVRLASARAGRKRRFVAASRYLEDAALHPQGRGLALTVRGGGYTMPLWEGAPLRHGPISTERRRLARYLPDGKRLVMIGADGGEEGLVVTRADGGGRARRIRGDFGRPLDLEVAPKGADRVALTSQRQEVLIVDLKTGEAVEVERSAHDRIGGMSWSPDGRWLAYAIHTSRCTSSIHVYDTRRKKVHEITRPDFVDFSPSFDPEGAHLVFLSHRVYDPVYDNQYFDLGFPRAVKPCLVTLRADLPSPFDAASREPEAPKGVRAGNGDEGKKDAEDKGVRIDFAGIQDRIVAFPLPEQRWQKIRAGRGCALLSHMPVEGFLHVNWATQGAPAAKQVLHVYRFAKQQGEVLVGGMTDFTLSGDAQSLLVRVGNRLRAISAGSGPKELSAKSDAGRETGWLDLDRLRVEVEPGAEWAQMFDEMWRLQRDQFWTPDMSHVDWQDAYARYRPLVERVASRVAFSDLAWELQGELGTSHCYELGGDYAPVPAWFQGQLGADVAWVASRSAWVIRAIPRGDSWDAGAASPLAAPGLGLSVGDAIVAVDGQRLGPRLSPAMCLANQAGRAVRLTVQAKPARAAKAKGKGKARPGKRRDVVVTTLRGEQMLRYRDWVEGNRALVHKATQGRVGYVHVPDMGPRGFSEFHRYYQKEVDRPGLIVDVRFNGGGHVSQLLLEKLRRERIGYGPSRYMGTDSYPGDAPMGPMVCLTNEFAGSDGDIFSHSWKLYGLGPLIGKRTWGGVVGIWPRYALVDGTITTQSEFAHWFQDVGWGVENHGTDPDIDVDIKPQDWKAGRDPQMERALKEIERIIRRRKPGVPDMGPRPNLKPPRLGGRA